MKEILKAKFALLLDHFHLRLDDIAELTDRQIDELYFHVRTEQGAIKPAEQPVTPKATLQSELMQLDIGRGYGLVDDVSYRQTVEGLRKKYGA